MDGHAQLARFIAQAKRRGQAPFFATLLDVIEPAAPVLAQVLLVAQPVANLWAGGAAFGALADLLEGPEGIAELRRQLADDGGE